MLSHAFDRRRLLVGAGALGLAGLVPTPSRAATKLNLGVLRLGSHAPSFIAHERGYFRDEGFDVELKFFEAAQPLAVAIASGDADYGVTAMSGGLVSLAEKDAVRVIGGALREEKGHVGSVVLASNKAWEAGLKSPKDLAGHSFGITTAGSSFHFMIHKVAQAVGVPMSEISLRPLQKLGAIVAALSSGQIDSWAIQPSIAKKMIDAGTAKQIGVISDYAPDYQVTTVFTSKANASDDRAKTKAFLKAYARAVDDFDDAFVDRTAPASEVDAIAEIVHRYVNTTTPADVARATLVSDATRINRGLALSMKSLREQLDWFKAEKMVKDTVTPEMVFDTSYVETI
ncbi:ABC transporter substrate-binding protein [Pinisolibacter aquiterrae]|uniref:ABC transporter substrate-binding protein n=1 Tax=Pinisolibacter aquiterrae TaxID=2815579 RepID=UPI001C3C7BAD|nr:ABC transporter substrate-binding protein [Pinisolibacter aquiterrae]MBV5264816.1 ABC transporter substrate-binding protein [Pinisolibacter aquiterrae]MCC8234235.1 ABC transporter substrate-binding protein [Pinisolibacter aquiterrae]